MILKGKLTQERINQFLFFKVDDKILDFRLLEYIVKHKSKVNIKITNTSKLYTLEYDGVELTVIFRDLLNANGPVISNTYLYAKNNDEETNFKTILLQNFIGDNIEFKITRATEA